MDETDDLLLSPIVLGRLAWDPEQDVPQGFDAVVPHPPKRVDVLDAFDALLHEREDVA